MVPAWIGAGVAKADLAALLAQQAQSKNRVRCTACKFLGDAPPEDATTLSEALSDPEMSAGMIARALQAYGVTVSPSAISRHRRECR